LINSWRRRRIKSKFAPEWALNKENKMTKLDEIRNRRLAPTDIAKIQAMAEVSDPLVIADELQDPPGLSELGSPIHLELKKESPEAPAVNDVAFYGPRVLEFFNYFAKEHNGEVSATLALAACTLKASVVIGQAITDMKMAVEHPMQTYPAIPVKAENPVIPAVEKKKRGRPCRVKK